MAAAVSTAPNLKATSSQGRSWKNPTRRPLLPSDSGSNVVAQRRPKAITREVASRYMSTSSSSSSTSSSTASNSSYPPTRRSASPLTSRTVLTSSATPALTALPRSSSNRSQSADRRRPATPRSVEGANGEEISTAAKALMSSKRNLSMSFQGDSFSTPINKTKPAAQPNSGKATAERRTTSAAMTSKTRGDHGENSRTAERNLWPARSRQVSSSVNPLSKSVDLGSGRKKLIGRSGDGVRALRQSLADRIDQIPCHDKLQDTFTSCVKNAESANLLTSSISASESAASDTESVCSDSNSGSKEGGNVPQSRAGPRGIIVPARVWQETNNRLRRLPEASSPLCRSNSLKATVSPSPRENLTNRGLSPLRNGGLRPASPSRVFTSTLPLEKNSPSRVMASPNRVRNAIAGTSGNTTSSVPSVLYFSADARRGKAGENRINDAHLLRLMYNRHLQWRFANSRAEAAMSLQRHIAETNIYNVWKATSDLRISVTNRRLELSRMSLKLKLLSIVKEQMMYLEEWGLMEEDHSNSLSGAIESLRASTLRLPIVCGAMADTQKLKDAMCTAFDVLQAMASSICSLMSKVEQMNSLLGEVVSTSSSELMMIHECRDTLSALAAFQVNDCSLRAHNLQLKQVAPSLPIET